MFLNMNLGHGKHLTISHKIADRFANLENLCFVQIKTLECVTGDKTKCIKEEQLQKDR